MTNLKKIQKELSKNVLLLDAKNAVKGGTCLPPPSGGNTIYTCHAIKVKKSFF